MLEKQITNAYAAIEIAIGKDKLHAQLHMPQQSDDRVDRASAFGSVDLRWYNALLLLRLTQCVNFVCSLSLRIALSAQKLSSVPPLEFDSESCQTNDLKIGFHRFTA